MSRAIAALGDAALLLPAWLLLALALVVARRVRAALVWSVAIAAAAGTTLAAKLLFHACGASMSDLDIASPSGHVSLATSFYGGLAIMLAVGRPRPVGWALGLGTVLLLAAIGASRIRTGAHTAEEVAIGFVIGAAAVAAFAVAYLRAPPPLVPAWPLAACLLVAIVALGGRHFSLEGRIVRAAREIASAADICEGSLTDRYRQRFHFGASAPPPPTR